MIEPKEGQTITLPNEPNPVKVVGFRAHGALVEAWNGVQLLTIPVRYVRERAVLRSVEEGTQ